MDGVPVPGDVRSTADPNAVMLKYVVEKACEAANAPRPPNQPAVQRHGHHFR
jgi:hypothetical protein